MIKRKDLNRRHDEALRIIDTLQNTLEKTQATRDEALAEADSWRRVAMDTMRALQEAEHSLRQIATRCQAAESAYQTATEKLKSMTA